MDELNKHLQDAKKRILSLEDNWDSYGAKGGYKEETFKRVESFLKSLYKKIHLSKFPSISPDDDMSIGIYWKTEGYELYLTIEEDPQEEISFYGDDYGTFIIEDKCPFNKLIDKLLPWLVTNELNMEIKNSKKHILGLKENWDGEGGRPFKKETMDNAIKIIKIIHSKIVIPPPSISPYVKGSIDVHWKNDTFQLLMCVEEGLKISGYYGDNYADVKIKGQFMEVEDHLGKILKWINKCTSVKQTSNVSGVSK
jgi:hypothetical protein